MKTVRVRVALGTNSYRIHIGSQLLARTGELLHQLKFTGGQAIIITCPQVRAWYGAVVADSLQQQGFEPVILEIAATEEAKSLTTATWLYQELGRLYAHRATPILALGGGMVGDVAGFVAATYHRGVPLIHLPTTLLAQVDSSIGGKNGLNCGNVKNQIGLIYQPRLVVCDIATLQTLPQREIVSSLAEVIKYAVVCDPAFFRYLETHLQQILALETICLEKTIARCAKIKASFVARDERDEGVRQCLNFGHTIAHALEAMSGFQLNHGEAVAVGMVLELQIASRLQLCKPELVDKITNLLTQAQLPTTLPPQLEFAALVDTMRHDKKRTSAKIRLALPTTIGKVCLQDVDVEWL